MFSHLYQRGKWQVFIDCTNYFSFLSIVKLFLVKPQCTIMLHKIAPYDKYISYGYVSNYDFYCPFTKGTRIIDILSCTPFCKYIKTEDRRYYVSADSAFLSEMNVLWKPGKIRILISPYGFSFKMRTEDLISLIERLKRSVYSDRMSVIILDVVNYNYLNKIHDDFYRSAPRMSLKRFITFVSTADIVISIATGTAHLAQALDKCLVAVYSNFDHINLFLPIENGRTEVVVSGHARPADGITDDFSIKKVIEDTESFIRILS